MSEKKELDQDGLYYVEGVGSVYYYCGICDKEIVSMDINIFYQKDIPSRVVDDIKGSASTIHILRDHYRKKWDRDNW
jgi:hypothetical protein